MGLVEVTREEVVNLMVSQSRIMNVAIIGAGLMAHRRAPAILKDNNSTLKYIASNNYEDAKLVANKFGCEPVKTWEEIIDRDDISIVVVSTPPDVHSQISIAAMKSGKHVLCEKPMTRTLSESEEMIKISEETNMILKCGFNHRHHPAIWEAKGLLDSGVLGRPLFARCIYGICGRPGYEKEWRANPSKAAGGQFIEQGTHGIDLFRWFLGDLAEVSCMTTNLYFTEQSLDEGGMAIFRSKSGAIANLHTTLTQWKNQFRFELFGEDGYVIVEGLGGSYGNEKLIMGKRDFTAPFSDKITEFRGGDISWSKEWEEFLLAIKNKRAPLGDGYDGLEAMKLGLAAYESEKKGCIIKI